MYEDAYGGGGEFDGGLGNSVVGFSLGGGECGTIRGTLLEGLRGMVALLEPISADDASI